MDKKNTRIDMSVQDCLDEVAKAAKECKDCNTKASKAGWQERTGQYDDDGDQGEQQAQVVRMSLYWLLASNP